MSLDEITVLREERDAAVEMLALKDRYIGTLERRLASLESTLEAHAQANRSLEQSVIHHQRVMDEVIARCQTMEDELTLHHAARRAYRLALRQPGVRGLLRARRALSA
jgi:predicted RNase H-like nuclease (RuvC/YqgF family)